MLRSKKEGFIWAWFQPLAGEKQTGPVFTPTEFQLLKKLVTAVSLLENCLQRWMQAL